MRPTQTPILPKWLPIALVSAMVITILCLVCWTITRRRRTLRAHHSTSQIAPPPRPATTNPRRPEPGTTRTKLAPSHSAHEESSSASAHSFTSNRLTHKSSPTTSSQFTDNDVASLGKLIRTASNRSLWKQDPLGMELSLQPRKVPSGQLRNEAL